MPRAEPADDAATATVETAHTLPNISPPARQPLPPRRPAAEVAAEDFAEWWETCNKRRDEGKLFDLLCYEGDYHTATVALLKAKKVEYLAKWRAEGLTLDAMAERANRSYSRIRELTPPELRPHQVKGAQFLRPFVGHERVRIHRDPQEVQRALQDLLSRIEDRAEHLGQRYLDGWQPGCGLAYEVWLIEEMAAAIANSRTFVRITQQCASAGISVAASGQRVTGDNIPTDARKQLAAAFQFGCRKEGRDQDYAISEAVIKAGARPDVWGNSRPGYCYAEIPGTDPDLWPAPARTFMADAQDIHNALHAPEKLHEKLAEIGASNQARTAFLTRVHELKADDVKVIRPADFNAVRDRYDRSASWVTMMLKALVKDGVLDELAHGMYMWHAREKVGAR